MQLKPQKQKGKTMNKMNSLDTKGFSIVYLLLVLVVVGGVGFVGWRVYGNKNATTSQSSTSPQTKDSILAVPEINDTPDLIKADQSLDSADIDGDLNSEQIEKDLNSIL
jgi:hypothetical protein